jgi:predicted nucleic acid-binding protein
VDRLFLDANVLFSAAYRETAGIQRLWTRPGVRLLTSTYAVDEARRNLSHASQPTRLDTLLEGVDVQAAGVLEPSLHGDVDLPEKDWPILSGAVLSEATHLITGDVRDFGPYFGTTILGVLVLPPSDYLRSVS